MHPGARVPGPSRRDCLLRGVLRGHCVGLAERPSDSHRAASRGDHQASFLGPRPWADKHSEKASGYTVGECK